MQKLITIFFFSLMADACIANDIFPRRITDTTYNVDSLRKIYGKNKNILSAFELQILIALSGYPELKDDFISFKFRHLSTTGLSSITINSIIVKPHHYIIYLTTKTKGKSVLLQDAPFNAQIGLIAHELAHIVDFKKKNIFQFSTWALNVISSKEKRMTMEKQTDLTVIQHGFGWQLYDWISFVVNDSNASEKYKNFKRRYYLQPAEIADIINNNNATQ